MDFRTCSRASSRVIMYLLHFEHPYNGPMQHYVGFTASDLDQRLKDHRAETGAVTTRRAFEQGIAFTVVRTWRWHAKTGTPDQGARARQLLSSLSPQPERPRHPPAQPDRCQWVCRGGRSLGRGFCASKTRPEGAP